MPRTKIASADPAKAGNSQENSRSRAEHLKPHQFRPGVSGNPSGRPRKLVTEALNELLSEKVPRDKQSRTKARKLADVLFARAMRGDVRAAVEIIDRTEGKATQGHEFSGPQGGSIPIEYKSPEENESALASLLARHGLKATLLNED